MGSILDDIAHETGGKSFKTYKFCYDTIEVPRLDYDEPIRDIHWERHGESEKFTVSRSLKDLADNIINSPSLFTYFLDGSRHVYKIDDIAYRNQVYPIFAGQVGIGCCSRVNAEMIPLYCDRDAMFERQLVITLPKIAQSSDWDDNDLAFEYLRNKINSRPELKTRSLSISKILTYESFGEEGEKLENRAIASIQNYMTEREQHMVAELNRRCLLDYKHFLMKDGSLEYRVHNMTSQAELARYKSNFRFVVGVSKSFNPANIVVKNNKNISNKIAQLPLYHRTPVSVFRSDRIGDVSFAIWYVRIRDARLTLDTFDGVLKIEKILPGKDQDCILLETDEVDRITGNIINERSPVCYGADRRWANHLYPIYITEKYIKSKYLGEHMFLKLF